MADVDVAYAVEVFRRDGVERLWTGRGNAELPVTRVAPSTGAFVPNAINPGLARPRGLEYGPDGVLYANGNQAGQVGAIWRVNSATGEFTRLATTGTLFGRSVFVVGGSVYFIQGIGTLYRLNAQGGLDQLAFVGAFAGNPQCAVELNGTVYMWSGGQSGGSWYAVPASRFTALTPLAPGQSTPFVQLPAPTTTTTAHYGATVQGGRILTVSPHASGTSTIRAVQFSPSYSETVAYSFSARNSWRSISDEPSTGALLLSDRTSIARVELPGARLLRSFFRGNAGLLDVAPPSAALDGSASFSVALASDAAKWLTPQGPVPVIVRMAMKTDGDWSLHPIRWEGVLSSATLSDGRYQITAAPLSASNRYQAREVAWSDQAQLQRTGGRDSALSRMSGGRQPLVFPSKV